MLSFTLRIVFACSPWAAEAARPTMQLEHFSPAHRAPGGWTPSLTSVPETDSDRTDGASPKSPGKPSRHARGRGTLGLTSVPEEGSARTDDATPWSLGKPPRRAPGRWAHGLTPVPEADSDRTDDAVPGRLASLRDTPLVARPLGRKGTTLPPGRLFGGRRAPGRTTSRCAAPSACQTRGATTCATANILRHWRRS